MKFEIIHLGKVIDTKNLVDGSYSIGRLAECDIHFDSANVSKKHACIIVQKGQMALVDEGSSNGTFLNGVLVKKHKLHLGDKIQIGDFTIRIPRNQNPTATKLHVSENLESAERIPMQMNTAVETPDDTEPTSSTLDSMIDLFFSPIEALVLFFDLRLVLGCILIILFGAATLLTVIPFSIWGKNIATTESLDRAHTVLQQLSRDNALIYAKSQGDTSRLTIDMAANAKGFLETLVIDPSSMTILAPQKYFNKSVQDPFALLAIKKIMEARLPSSSVERNDTVYVVAEPILGISENTDRNLAEAAPGVVAVVLADFEISNSLLSTVEPTTRSMLFAILMALLALAISARLISSPINSVTEQLELALKGTALTIESPIKFGPLSELAKTVNFAVSRMQKSTVSSQGDFSSQSAATDPLIENMIQELDKICSDGLLLLDRDKRVCFVGHVTEELINLRTQYAKGQNIAEACRDPSFSGTAVELADRVVQNFGETQQASLEINGISRGMGCSPIRTADGQISYFVISLKMGEGGT